MKQRLHKDVRCRIVDSLISLLPEIAVYDLVVLDDDFLGVCLK